MRRNPMTAVTPGTGVPVPAAAETQLDAVGRVVAPKAATGQQLRVRQEINAQFGGSVFGEMV